MQVLFRSSLVLFLLWLTSSCGLAVATVEAQPATPQGPFDHSHAAWSRILGACVRDGGFDYAKLKAERAPFDEYLTTLRAVTPETLASWPEKQRFAFWINTYNAYCVQKVIDNYPLKSIRKLDGFAGINTVFDKAFIPMRALHPDGNNAELTLNDIEHEILRKRFKDARVHAAINCASKSCPPLLNEAFTADRLDSQLEKQMRAFVRDSSRNRIDPTDKKLEISKIFDWFEEDFERETKSVKEYLVRYAPSETADFIRSARVSYLDYDWDLNDVPKK